MTRLPAIVGVWIMLMSMFRFVSRRCGPRDALVALLFPTATIIFDYIAEGRPYGLELGLSALALVCWQGLGEAASPGVGLARLALWGCLAGAVFTHYFAVLCFVPIGLGELARTWNAGGSTGNLGGDRRRAGAAGGVPAVHPIRLDLLGRLLGERAHVLQAPWYYEELVGPEGPAAAGRGDDLGGLRLLPPRPMGRARPRKPTRRPTATRRRPPLCEVVAAAGFAAIPIVGLVLAQFGTEHAVFTPRYALPTVIGLGILPAYVAARAGRRMRLGGRAGRSAWRPGSAAGWSTPSAGCPAAGSIATTRGPGRRRRGRGPADRRPGDAPLSRTGLLRPQALRVGWCTSSVSSGTSSEEITRRMVPLAASTRPLHVEEYDRSSPITAASSVEGNADADGRAAAWPTAPPSS